MNYLFDLNILIKSRC